MATFVSDCFFIDIFWFDLIQVSVSLFSIDTISSSTFSSVSTLSIILAGEMFVASFKFAAAASNALLEATDGETLPEGE